MDSQEHVAQAHFVIANPPFLLAGVAISVFLHICFEIIPIIHINIFDKMKIVDPRVAGFRRVSFIPPEKNMRNDFLQHAGFEQHILDSEHISIMIR